MLSILLRPSCPDQDDPEIRRLLELIASISGSSFVELEIVTPDGETRSYRRGEPPAEASTHRLKLRHHRAVLRLGGVGRQQGAPLELVAFALDGTLQRLRSSAQLSVLMAGMETSTSGVLLFDRGGEIVYANPRAEALLPQSTEGSPDGEPPVRQSPTVRERVQSMAKTMLDGRVPRPAWNSLLVLSDGSMLGCEVVRIGGDKGVSGVAVAGLLQPLTTVPGLFLEAFCARHGVSPREQEVIGLLLEGCGTSDMANRLSISEHTVRDHLKRLYRKTGTCSRSELISVVSTVRMDPARGPGRR